MAESLSKTIHALFKVGNTPTHAIRDFTFSGSRLVGVSPTFHIAAISVLMVGSRQQNFANLKCRHFRITRGQNTKGAGDERSSHGSAAVTAITATDVGRITVHGRTG